MRVEALALHPGGHSVDTAVEIAPQQVDQQHHPKQIERMPGKRFPIRIRKVMAPDVAVGWTIWKT